MNERFHIDAELTIWCEAIQKRCVFAARLYDRKTERHYGGAGETAFEALAWCMDDFVRRALLGHAHSPSMNADARPGDGLTPAPSSRPRRITPAPIVRGSVEQAANANSESGCFEQQIPTAPAPRFFSLESPIATSTPTTPRRARGGRR